MHTGARPGLQPSHRAPAGSGGRRRSGRLAGLYSPPRGPRRPPALPPRGLRAPPPCGLAPPPREGAGPPEPSARANPRLRGAPRVIAVRAASSGARSAWHTHSLHALAAEAAFPHLRRHPPLSVKDAGPRPRARARGPTPPAGRARACRPRHGSTPAGSPPGCSWLEDPGIDEPAAYGPWGHAVGYD
uniref:Uncharacterized protein n=1 Tax=Rangifer tarandus platyrhynchus TaxID=3082113 RepID=A0ACB0DW38_RANTA|nr:unnamed protein product [Rangifer tarandus platyrhynchus]